MDVWARRDKGNLPVAQGPAKAGTDATGGRTQAASASHAAQPNTLERAQPNTIAVEDGKTYNAMYRDKTCSITSDDHQ